MFREEFSAKLTSPGRHRVICTMVYEENCSFFFLWLKRQEIEGQWTNSYGNSTLCTGTIKLVILLSLLSGTSPHLSSSHLKNLQMHPPYTYALSFICKEVATEMKHLIKKP